MNSARQTLAGDNREWYFVHVLAGLTVFEVVLLACLNIVLRSFGKDFEFPLAIRIVAALGAVALMWFWVRMLIDYFRQRPAKHPVAWGWFLFLGAYFGGLAYFYFVWRPRHSTNDT